MSDEDLSTPKTSGAWTQAEAYVVALAQRRTARKSREARTRSQPEAPRFLLSTLPFLMLIGALILLAAAIIVLAWPAKHQFPRKQQEINEVGTARKGWFEEAKREFHG